MRIISLLRGQLMYALIVLMGFTYFLIQSIDPGIICFIQETVPETFSDGFRRIGGINDVMAMHVISLFNFKTAGMLLVSMLLGLFFLSLLFFYRHYQRHPYYPAAIFIISFSLLLPLFEYTFSFKLTSSILFSTYLLAFTAFISQYFKTFKWLPYSAILILIYYLFGSPGFYISCLILIIHPSVPKNHKLLYVLLLLAIPALSMIAGMSYTLQQAYYEPFVPGIYHKVKPAAYAIYVVLPLLIHMLQSSAARMAKQTMAWKKVLNIVLQFGIPILLSAAVFKISFEPLKKEIYQIELYAQKENWQGVLRSARHFQNHQSILLQFQINRALYHQGILLDKLIHYPQAAGLEGIFLDSSTDGHIAQPKADFYCEMGYGNESRHFANEALISRGNRPHTLKCLILNYAAAEQYEIATKYWKVLSHSIAHRKWTLEHEGLLHGETDETILRIQQNFPERDFFTGLARPENKLKRFFINNPQNKMAFEYLIANYLISHKLGNVVNELKTFRQLGYTHLPRMVEEAVLLYLGMTNASDFDFSGYEISKEALQDFQDFSNAIQKAGGISKARLSVQHHSHTYWYYVMYASKMSKVEKQ